MANHCDSKGHIPDEWLSGWTCFKFLNLPSLDMPCISRADTSKPLDCSPFFGESPIACVQQSSSVVSDAAS